MTPRDQLRRELRYRRSIVPFAERERAAQQVALHLVHSPWFRAARHIAVYLAIGGELDTQPTIKYAHAAGRHIYLPVITRDGRLSFHRWRPQAPMRRNRYGIMEPATASRHRLDAHALDLVLTPLVGFDPQGNRLGMGGGFYDRTFAYQRLMRHWRYPPLVGLAYEFQEIQMLQREPWDVPLAGIITPAGMRRFPST